MANSALGTPTFQALAGNIKNQDGSPSIYSAGMWTFENSSGVTTFSVSDAGAVTAGSASGGTVSTLYGSWKVWESSSGKGGMVHGVAANSTYNGLLLASNLATGTFNGTQADAALPSWGIDLGGRDTPQYGASDTLTVMRRAAGSATVVSFATCSSAGAWTWGPSSFTQSTKHQFNGQIYTYTSGEVAVSSSDTVVIDFNGKVAGLYLVTAVREGGNVGTNGCWIVGNNGVGTAVLYATIFTNDLTATISGDDFRLRTGGTTQNIYTNAVLLVCGP